MNELKKILKTTADGAFIVNEDLELIFANEAAKRLLGIRKMNGVSLHCYSLIRGQDPEQRLVCHEKCGIAATTFRGGEVRDFNVKIQTKSNNQTLLNMSVLHYRDREGCRYLIHLFREIADGRRRTSSVSDDYANLLIEEGDAQDAISGTRPIRKFAELTAREREVLGQLVHGARTEEISERLSISVNTTRNHIQHILQKLDVHSRMEAVTYVMRHDLFNRWLQTRWW